MTQIVMYLCHSIEMHQCMSHCHFVSVFVNLCHYLSHCMYVDEGGGTSGGGGTPGGGAAPSSPPDGGGRPTSPPHAVTPSTVHGLAVAIERGLQRSPSSDFIHPTQLQSGEQGAVCVCVCVCVCFGVCGQVMFKMPE